MSKQIIILHEGTSMLRSLGTVLVYLTFLATWFVIPRGLNPQRVFAEPNQFEPSSHRKESRGVFFEANLGQLDQRVKFSAGGAGYKLFLTSNEAVYVIPERKAERPRPIRPDASTLPTTGSSRAVAVWMKLAGADQNAEAVGMDELAGKHNYFRGNNPNKWQTNVSLYQRARLRDVYPGINMEWHGSDDAERIEYDFKVAPNASAHQIEWRIEGADNITVDESGSLRISTPFGELKQNAPVTYQESGGVRNIVESRFEKRGEKRVGFAVADYDRSNLLTIDPVSDLSYSTYLGGELDETGYAIADGGHGGGTFVTGSTLSMTFPTTVGVFNTTHAGSDDVFVTKLNDDASGLVYSTFIGGGGRDVGKGIAVDSSGNAYITGITSASGAVYPTTADAPFPTNSGDVDAFVTKLNPTGSALVYSTFVGGDSRDEARGIALRGNLAYIVGHTASSDYPTTVGAWDTTSSSSWDIFVTKLDAAGANLTYSTYIGDVGGEESYGIAVDSAGNAFIVGATNGFGYPTTAGAYQTTHGGNFDAVVTKLNSNGSALIYSTFVGGTGRDIPQAIAIDGVGNAFITGQTNGGAPAFPTTVGAFDTTYNGGFNNEFTEGDAFVTKLNPTGTALVYSTLIGGNGYELGTAIAVNAAGNAFVTGITESFFVQYPTTAGAFKIRNPIGGFEVFFTKLTASGSALIYSTLIGGGSGDVGYGIALNSVGDAFLTGLTANNGAIDFPTTPGVFQPEGNGDIDAFVCRFRATSNFPIVRAPFDFDGDGKTDIGIFRPVSGQWWYQRSSDLQVPALTFGAGTDKITPVDLSGDGRTDVAFWRPSTGEWFVLRSEDNSYFALPFGTNGDVPVPADYDGDGKADIAIFRPSTATWYINRSSGGTTILPFGLNGDAPVIADYDGDGRSDIAIFRPGPREWWIQRSSNGQVLALQFGAPSDKAVPGDYTGDGKADVAVWRPSTGFWIILRSEDFSYYGFPFGASGDVPVVGDYDGDAKTDPAVFRPSGANWFISRSTGGVYIQPFGLSPDKPVATAFLP